MDNLHTLTATQAIRLIQAGSLDPIELAEACLARIAEREPQVRAFHYFDADGVRRDAAAARKRPLAGALQGIPIGVKDVLDTADMPSGYGSPIWDGWRPRADAAAVAWAKRAGAVVMGKTVTTEFATRQPGPTANPAGLEHTPGGSSSGSAAGVADGFFPLAYGTQTAGSVIRPAAYCGVVGYKPTYNTIERFGMKVMSASLDTVGVMARSVADCALFAAAVSTHDLGDPDTKPDRAPRVGICMGPTAAAALPETEALRVRIANAIGRAGARVSDRELPTHFNDLIDAHPIVMNHESARAMGWELEHAREGLSVGLRERLEFGLSRSIEQVAAAYAVFDRTQRAFPDAMDGLDVLITPSAPGEAPKGLEWTGDPSFNFVWTCLHVPCVTVPAGLGPNGMPLGIQIVGRRGEDKAVLAWAQWVAAAIGN